jgi:xeroderma pigmentosum group C-complementing protein
LTAAVEQSWTVSDQTVLLAAMARSMGWRARYVQAMDPVSPDLDVGHPLLSTVKNLFSGVFVGGNSYAKRMRTDMLETATSEEQRGSDDQKLLGWIEILCHDGKAKSGHRWVHIDPVNRLFDAPHKIENLLSERSSKKRGILPYALAVEHVGLEETRLRLTDVTPRYAHSWLASLRRRGVARHKNCSIEDEVHNSWWSWTLRKINDFHRPPGANQRGTPARPRSGCSAEDAIMIDVDDQQGTPASLKSGSSVQDAIALETEEDDERKPSAVSKLADAFEDIDKHEREELKESANNEVIPTSKAAFQKHPMYVIPSVLGKAEVLSPDASKRICGVFKGELVYRRADVSTALPAKKWLYQGRKVLDEELNRPVKRVKARKKPASKNFQALRSYGVGDTNDGSEARRAQDIEEASKPLDDGTENLYGKFQTEPWSPSPVGPADPIPVNEHKNVDLKLLNPGLVHIDRPGLAKVAKKLGIPYAPCLIGFGGHGGNRTPEIRGIVVHQHNSGLIREAGVEVMSHAREEEEKTRRRAVDLRWKKLMVGLLTKDRLEKEYG